MSLDSSVTAITADQNVAGESALGDLIADAQRESVDADFAVMNPGGIRTNLDAGPITWGELFGVQPFGNTVVRLTATGQDIYDLLEQQWTAQSSPRMLQISGFEYTWRSSAPVGNRIVVVSKDGIPIERTANYTIAVNSFLADGGDGFTVLARGHDPVVGPIDLDALTNHIQRRAQPISVVVSGRILRVE
ncbi:MAG: 5'-nucleotidase [Polyangiaceae bacterium]